MAVELHAAFKLQTGLHGAAVVDISISYVIAKPEAIDGPLIPRIDVLDGIARAVMEYRHLERGLLPAPLVSEFAGKTVFRRKVGIAALQSAERTFGRQ